MLTDMIEVEEFEIKEEEPWYDNQDLEHGKYFYSIHDYRDCESAGSHVLCVSNDSNNLAVTTIWHSGSVRLMNYFLAGVESMSAWCTPFFHRAGVTNECILKDTLVGLTLAYCTATQNIVGLQPNISRLSQAELEHPGLPFHCHG